MQFNPSFPYHAIMFNKTGFLLLLWQQQLGSIIKLENFVESPEYQAVTSEVPNFLQEIPRYFTEILVSTPLFDEVNDTILQYLHRKRIENDTAWAIAEGFPDKEERMPLLGS